MKARIRIDNEGDVFSTGPDRTPEDLDCTPFAPQRVWEIDTDAGTCVEIQRKPKPATPGKPSNTTRQLPLLRAA